ncbi:MAG TPA: hypothetical protein VFM02_01555 [Candidatus Paceibacterota bacterium]|nr:hypothetical protein [Candidatus Paceibacterota bacterium]
MEPNQQNPHKDLKADENQNVSQNPDPEFNQNQDQDQDLNQNSAVNSAPNLENPDVNSDSSLNFNPNAYQEQNPDLNSSKNPSDPDPALTPMPMNTTPATEIPVSDAMLEGDISSPASLKEKMVSPVEMAPRSGRAKAWIVSILIVLALVAILSGAYAAWHFFIQGSPKQVVLSSFEELEQAQTFAFDGDVNVDVPDSDPKESFSFDLTYSGKIDRKANASEITSGVNVRAGNQGGFGIGVETRVLGGKDLYFHFTKIPPFLLPFGLNTQDWISMTDFKNNQFFKNSEGSKLSDADQAELQKIFLQNENALQITEPFPETTLDGKTVRHFAIDFDKASLRNFLGDLGVFIAKQDASSTEFSQADIDQFKQSITNGLKNVQNLHGEIWVEKDSNLPQKITLNFDVKESASSSESTGSSTPMIHVQMMTHFSNFGDPVTIEKPENSKPFEQVTKTLEGSRGAGIDLGDVDSGVPESVTKSTSGCDDVCRYYLDLRKNVFMVISQGDTNVYLAGRSLQNTQLDPALQSFAEAKSFYQQAKNNLSKITPPQSEKEKYAVIQSVLGKYLESIDMITDALHKYGKAGIDKSEIKSEADKGTSLYTDQRSLLQSTLSDYRDWLAAHPSCSSSVDCGFE